MVQQARRSSRIPPSSVKGMATEQTAKSLGGSLQHSIALNSIAGIFGTTRCEAACGRKPWRNNQFVDFQKPHGPSLPN